MIYEKLGEDDWRLGQAGFFKLDGNKKATNPDHEMLTANGYTVKDEPIPEATLEPIPIPETNEGKWRTYMKSISWNRDLTWGKS